MVRGFDDSLPPLVQWLLQWACYLLSGGTRLRIVDPLDDGGTGRWEGTSSASPWAVGDERARRAGFDPGLGDLGPPGLRLARVSLRARYGTFDSMDSR